MYRMHNNNNNYYHVNLAYVIFWQTSAELKKNLVLTKLFSIFMVSKLSTVVTPTGADNTVSFQDSRVLPATNNVFNLGQSSETTLHTSRNQDGFIFNNFSQTDLAFSNFTPTKHNSGSFHKHWAFLFVFSWPHSFQPGILAFKLLKKRKRSALNLSPKVPPYFFLWRGN